MKALATSQPASKVQPATKRKKLPSFRANPAAYGLLPGALGARTKELKGKTPKINKSVFHESYDEKLVEQLGPIPGLNITEEPYLIPPPEMRLVDPRTIYIDRNYQRSLAPMDVRLLEDIGNVFDWDEYKVPNVFENEQERLFVTDGQKTVLAAIHRKVPLIPVLVIKAPASELLKRQANSFVGINVRRKAIPANEIFTALLVRGDKQERAMATILRANGIKPVNVNGGARDEFNVNETRSINILRYLHKQHGDANFEVICKIMAAARFKPIKREHINALGTILDNVEADKLDVDRMANAIRSIVDRHALLEAREAHRKSTKNITVGRALADIYLTRYKQKAKALDQH